MFKIKNILINILVFFIFGIIIKYITWGFSFGFIVGCMFTTIVFSTKNIKIIAILEMIGVLKENDEIGKRLEKTVKEENRNKIKYSR